MSIKIKLCNKKFDVDLARENGFAVRLINSPEEYLNLQYFLIDHCGPEGLETWTLNTFDLVIHDEKFAMIFALKYL